MGKHGRGEKKERSKSLSVGRTGNASNQKKKKRSNSDVGIQQQPDVYEEQDPSKEKAPDTKKLEDSLRNKDDSSIVSLDMTASNNDNKAESSRAATTEQRRTRPVTKDSSGITASEPEKRTEGRSRSQKRQSSTMEEEETCDKKQQSPRKREASLDKIEKPKGNEAKTGDNQVKEQKEPEKEEASRDDCEQEKNSGSGKLPDSKQQPDAGEPSSSMSNPPTNTKRTPRSLRSSFKQNKLASEESGTREEPKSARAEKDEDTMKMEKDVDADKDEPLVKRAPTLDTVVHRMRHLNYLPKSIVDICAAPRHSPHRNLLAVSREGGNVELRSMNQQLRTLATVCGQPSKTINAMAWVLSKQTDDDKMVTDTDHETKGRDIPNLVGASLDGSIFVVNFTSSRVEGMIPSGGGGIFVLQSLYENDDDTRGASLVAAGCEDGSIRIFECYTDNNLTLISTVPTTSAAVLSLAWRRMEPVSDDSHVLAGIYIFAGVADGTIRTYRYQIGRTTGAIWKSGHRMTVESMGRTTHTRIWSLKLLKDWTVVSADSLGNVQFWDGKTGSLEQTFQQTDQKSDVLDICVTHDECKVFASGVDSRVIVIERQSASETVDHTNNSRRWIMTHAQRPHTHDVKALAVCSNEMIDDAGNLVISEVLISGGVDMKLCTYLVEAFPTKRPRTIYPWPAETPIIVASKAHFLAIIKESRAEVHRLGEHEGDIVQPVPVAEDKTLLGTVEVKTLSSLKCGAFSEDGRHMLLCDSHSVFIFKINCEKGSFSPVRIPFDEHPESAVSSASFLGNESILLATSDGKLQILAVQTGTESNEDQVRRRQSVSPGGPGMTSLDLSGRFPVNFIAPTTSGKCFATMCNTYGNSAVDLYVRDEDNTYRYWWTLPKLLSPITAVSFLPKSESRLVVACVNFELYVFDVRQRELDSWSSQSGNSVTGPVPTELSTRNDYPVRICTHPKYQDKILLGAYGVFLLVDLSKPPPRRCRTVPEKHVRRKKRKRARSISEDPEADDGSEAVQCLRYNSMLFMGFTASSEMIIVEQPWLNVVATLPDALQRKIYGAG